MSYTICDLTSEYCSYYTTRLNIMKVAENVLSNVSKVGLTARQITRVGTFVTKSVNFCVFPYKVLCKHLTLNRYIISIGS